MKNLKLNNVIILTIAFLAGLTVGEYPGFEYFVLSPDINTFDYLSLITTIILALYVTRKLDKGTSINNRKKELYLEKINYLERQIEVYIEDLIQSDKPYYHQVNSGLHICKLSKRAIVNNLSNDISADCDKEIADVDRRFSEIRILLTKTVDDKNNVDFAYVDNGIMFFPRSCIQNVLTETQKVKDILFQIKLKINNG